MLGMALLATIGRNIAASHGFDGAFNALIGIESDLSVLFEPFSGWFAGDRNKHAGRDRCDHRDPKTDFSFLRPVFDHHLSSSRQTGALSNNKFGVGTPF